MKHTCLAFTLCVIAALPAVAGNDDFATQPVIIEFDLRGAEQAKGKTSDRIMADWMQQEGKSLSVAPMNRRSAQRNVIAAVKDRKGSDELRAVQLGRDVSWRKLTNGRYATPPLYWSKSFLAHLPSWCRILTPQQRDALLPPEPDI